MTHAEAVSTLATERYLLDEMTEPERDAFEEHFFECPVCAEDLKAGSLMRDAAKRGLLRPTTVSRPSFGLARTPTPAKRMWYHSTVVPWAVAATLAVVVGYQAGPRQPTHGAATIAAVTPTVLRPASRGAAPVVSGAAGYVALALDVDSEGAAELAYALRTQAGRELLSGTSTAPPAGSPLVLVIPTFTLTVQERYSLSVRDAARPDRPLGEFAFTVDASR